MARAADGTVLGAIGVGGLPSAEDDEKIAKVGLEALLRDG